MAVECEQQQFASTKVYYHLDASMPYLSEVPVPQEKLTLGDFKKVFTRKGYSYFCKAWDQRLQKEVKVEIWHDRQRLHKSANGLVELFLLSQNTAGPRNSNTLPKLKKEDGASTMSSLAASSDLDIGGGQRVSMVTGTEASSDLQTLISRRAGEHLADLYNSTSEDPYNRTSISSSCIQAPLEGTKERAGNSSLLPILGQKYRHRAGKKRGKPYVPSTISSESESSYSLPRIEEVKLRLQEAPLGISVACQDGSIFIYHIQHGSAAEKSGQMEIGDQIVQVNDIRFEDLDEKQALELLKKLNSLKKTITVYVAKRKRVNGESSTEERKSDALSMLCETKQLDISQWVESTAQQQGRAEAVQPFADSLTGEKLQSKKETALSEAKKWTEMEETSDEEMAAYMDRRNGKGAKLVPALTKARQQQQREEAGGKRHEMVVSEPFTLGAAATARPLLPVVIGIGADAAAGNAYANCSSSPSALAQAPPLVQQPLHADMEPETILRRMVEPDSGLTIRDRKWLKIPVPMSFIGDEMVDWLLANVQGFRGRKAAKEFASKLLQKGLIKHVVNMSTFNQNCYYVFDDRIIAARMMEKAERLAGEEGSRHSNIGEQQQQQRELNGNGTVPTGATVLNANGRSNQPAMATGTAGLGIGPPESTTEITYMSDPTSPFPGQPARAQIAGTDVPAPRMVVANNPRYVTGPASLNMCQPQKPPLASNNNHVPAIPLRVLNPTKVGPGHLPSWPISPILPFHRPPRALQTATAGTNEPPDSPEATNDYASLIQGEINCGAQFDVHFDGILQQQQMAFAPQRAAKENGGGSNGHLPPSPAPIPAAAPSGPPPPAVILPAPPLPQRHPFMAVPKRSPA